MRLGSGAREVGLRSVGGGWALERGGWVGSGAWGWALAGATAVWGRRVKVVRATRNLVALARRAVASIAWALVQGSRGECEAGGMACE